MTPRDRALAALSGEEVFPIPADVFISAMYPEVEAGLLKHYGLAEGEFETLLDRLGAHHRWASPIYTGPELAQDPDIFSRYPHKIATMNIWGTWDGPEIYSGFLRPLEHAETVADVDAHPWPDPDWFDYQRVGWIWGPQRSLHEWAAQNANYLRVGSAGWQPLFSRLSDLFGMEKALLNMALNPKVIEAALDHIVEFLSAHYRRTAEAGRGIYDVLALGDDFASQRAPLMSPVMWRRFFKPAWAKLFAVAHANGMKTSYHSCGAVRPVLGDLIDAGLDILEVVQVSATGMDPHELKQEFGQHLAFYGGMDVQNFLPNATPEEVRAEARRLIEIFGSGGRYIFSSTHFLMEDVPIENVVAMYEEARQYIPGKA